MLLALLPLVQTNAQNQDNSVITISLNTIGGLQYDLVRFSVMPGARVKILFTNRDEMSHNLVFTKPDARKEIVDAALKLGENGPAMNYIPESSDVLWYIPMLDPGESDSVEFRAPRKTGIYPYVCTFIGHGFIMYGAMYVTNGVMPPLSDDENIPEIRRKEEDGQLVDTEKHLGHPYKPEPPFLYRVLMPDAGPAAIAVSLPNKLSYCWDAGACRLRYAWTGAFLDMTDYWTIKLEEHARILGKIFYRDKSTYPLRVGNADSVPEVDFKGYNTLRKYPEFQYSIDGITIREMIYPKSDGSGLLRTFKIPQTDKNIWFVFNTNDGASYESSVGQFENGQLELTPDEAREFTITMTRVNGVEF
ncbi:MAG: plastocyanin/azurin family copper-binding protein [Bacteroidetes bacterium]|nr:plastocyanin/azurin family copper-binding protein [Bacteroidota bacterium]MDA1121677.1 plastocyanin/azurin family copper-binding protein [Bacteroidota bacterium]